MNVIIKIIGNNSYTYNNHNNMIFLNKINYLKQYFYIKFTKTLDELTIFPKLLGGKGGFGSLMRNEASKNKKIKNLNMAKINGRRIRDIKNEIKLLKYLKNKTKLNKEKKQLLNIKKDKIIKNEDDYKVEQLYNELLNENLNKIENSFKNKNNKELNEINLDNENINEFYNKKLDIQIKNQNIKFELENINTFKDLNNFNHDTLKSFLVNLGITKNHNLNKIKNVIWKIKENPLIILDEKFIKNNK